MNQHTQKNIVDHRRVFARDIITQPTYLIIIILLFGFFFSHDGCGACETTCSVQFEGIVLCIVYMKIGIVNMLIRLLKQ